MASIIYDLSPIRYWKKRVRSNQSFILYPPPPLQLYTKSGLGQRLEQYPWQSRGDAGKQDANSQYLINAKERQKKQQKWLDSILQEQEWPEGPFYNDEISIFKIAPIVTNLQEINELGMWFFGGWF